MSGTQKSLPAVPRSKGCLTCIARKKRCDGRRPTCQACEDRKQVCQGYRREDIVFLNDGWRAPGVAAANAKKSRSKSRSPETQEAGRGTLILQSAAASPSSLQRSPSIDRSQLHTSFFLAEFAEQLLPSSHFIADLFRSYFSLSSSTSSEHQPLSTSAAQAVDALAQGYFGRANGDLVSIKKSFDTYGVALRSMSTKIAELQAAHSGFHHLSEEEWQHMAFYCMVMAFWELKMSPSTDNWQQHLRALATAITLRGSSHAYSKSNLRLVATARLFITLQALSSRRPGDLSVFGWRQSSPLPSEWVIEATASVKMNQDAYSTIQFRVYSLMDSLLASASDISVVMAQYDQLLINMANPRWANSDGLGQTLVDLYNVANVILGQIEGVSEELGTTMSELPYKDWLSTHQPASNHDAGSIREREFITTIGSDIHSFFPNILNFPSMNDFNTVAFYWTISILLRLLINDMLALMQDTNPKDMPENPQYEIDQHRIRLVYYAQSAIRAIPFVEAKENRSQQPFFMASAFQTAIAALGRECEHLRSQVSEEVTILGYASMKRIVERYMDWAQQRKILLRMVVDIPRHPSVYAAA
uniref:Zn(2)-C6 fungal-type domain-containing protein n=1 Tax=Bionectria ochroleuca TaxID=29856 RepID=A0A0B7KCE8_BIOOC